MLYYVYMIWGECVNQELFNKINEAIKNNDREMIEKLSKENNIKISVNISSNQNNNLNDINSLNNINNFQNLKLVSKTKIDSKDIVKTDENSFF